MEVFEGHILAMHKQQWGSAPDDVSAAANTQDGSAVSSTMQGVTETSSYVNDLQNAVAVFRWEWLAAGCVL
jgi:hypothetical protein